jgi:hypothetical protein
VGNVLATSGAAAGRVNCGLSRMFLGARVASQLQFCLFPSTVEQPLYIKPRQNGAKRFCVLKRREVAVIAHLMGKAFAVAALGLLASFMLGGPWLFH